MEGRTDAGNDTIPLRPERPRGKNEWTMTRLNMLKIPSLVKLLFFLLLNNLACYLDVFVVSFFESSVKDFLELLFQII